jgi:hypothetical protein
MSGHGYATSAGVCPGLHERRMCVLDLCGVGPMIGAAAFCLRCTKCECICVMSNHRYAIASHAPRLLGSRIAVPSSQYCQLLVTPGHSSQPVEIAAKLQFFRPKRPFGNKFLQNCRHFQPITRKVTFQRKKGALLQQFFLRHAFVRSKPAEMQEFRCFSFVEKEKRY